jgi:CHAD domain-containing protein
MASYSRWAEASPDETVAAVAVRSLGARFQAVQEYLEKAATQSEKDVEHVHQMRVWSRRAAAALDLYQGLMPAWRVERVAKHLKRIRRAANDARDDDVFAHRLGKDQDDLAAKMLLEKVQTHRHRVQEPIVAVYRKLGKSGSLARRTAKLLSRTGTGRRAEAGTVRFGDWAVCRMQAEAEDFFLFAAADLSDIRTLHQLRIAGKNVRYTIELLGCGLPAALREHVYPMIKDLQDRLGAINDHATAQQRLDRWIQEADSDAERDYLATRRDAEHSRTESLRGEFLDWWNGTREGELRQAFAESLGSFQSV